MPEVNLIQAQDAFMRADAVRRAAFAELISKVPFVLKEINGRIEKAIAEGKLFIELTREEIETVPDVTPDLFVAYLQDQGYTLLSNHKGSFALYFHNPMKD